jgi:translation initiation factor 2 subunit 3
MDEKIDISKLETLNVGIVGHIDHGKTTLLQRLSGKWADTHSEELKRGITIKLGYADAVVRENSSKDSKEKFTIDSNSKEKPVKYLTFVDAPGHEMLMATMLSGAAIVDAAILVVAANEGIKPQTKEHLVALEAKKIKKIIIAQNKIDLVSKEKAIENHKEIKNLIKGTVAENAPIIPISAQQGINLDKILEELCKIKISFPEKSEDAVFFIARSFDINKPGSEIKKLHGGVLGGALKRGILKIGDTIEIKPGYSYQKQNQHYYKTVKSKIVSMKKGKYQVTEATPGGSLAIETELDPSLTKADSLSGGIASKENFLPEITEDLKIKFTLFEKVLGTKEHEQVQKLKINEMLMLSINTSITVGKISKINKDSIELKLKIPVVPLKGESLGIARNMNGHWRLIGFGEII